MAGKNDNFDALMAMMALKHIMDDTKDIEIHPFTCEVTVTPTSISCSSSGNKAFLEDIDGGMDLASATNVRDIIATLDTGEAPDVVVIDSIPAGD